VFSECFNVGNKGPGCVVIEGGGREGFARATLVEEDAAVVGWVEVLSIRVHGSLVIELVQPNEYIIRCVYTLPSPGPPCRCMIGTPVAVPQSS
jgi:hypothetical protein